jgi:hypothetical protein
MVEPWTLQYLSWRSDRHFSASMQEQIDAVTQVSMNGHSIRFAYDPEHAMRGKKRGAV